MRIDAISFTEAIDQVMNWSFETHGRYVCAANVHMCMEAYDIHKFSRIVNNADLVVPDGRPMLAALQLLGIRSATQIRGADFLFSLCQAAEKSGVPIGLYGGTPDSLYDFKVFVKKEFPALDIACAISPPFRPLTVKEDKNFTRQIKESGTRILFVGLGCPKQELWMASHKDTLSCVMVGFGIAFDFLSGRVQSAPKWMQKAGLEWVFRLACEPRRLWKRYLKHNPRFIWHFGKQVLLEKRKG